MNIEVIVGIDFGFSVDEEHQVHVSKTKLFVFFHEAGKMINGGDYFQELRFPKFEF